MCFQLRLLPVTLILLLSLGCIVNAKDSLFSIQIATFYDRKSAENFIKRLPDVIKGEAFLYITDKGFFTVRIGVSRKTSVLNTKLQQIKSLFPDAIIVPTSREKLGNYNSNKLHQNRLKSTEELFTDYTEPKREFLKNFEVLIKDLETLIHKVFAGTEEPYGIIKPEGEHQEEDHSLLFKTKRQKLFERRTPFYITGEARLREKAFFEEDSVRSKGFAYIGLRFSLFEEGMGEYAYKSRKAELERYGYERLSTSNRLYSLLVGRQEQLLRNFLRYEKEAIRASRERLLVNLEKLLSNLKKLDARFEFLRRKYLAYGPSGIPQREKEGLHLPVVSVNLDSLITHMSLQKEALKRELALISDRDRSSLEAYRDYRFDLYARYYLVDDGGIGSYIAVGARMEIPIPFDTKLRKEVNELEFISLRDAILEKLSQNHSNALDYAFRMLHNAERIEAHFIQIRRDLLDIERELFFWKHGVKDVNYERLLSALLDIYDRLSQVADYKYLNLQYAQKIAILLNLKEERELLGLFYEGI
ncbi:MAG: SPOR domain-containing protein [Aquificae bacterium]|nr:SPOR domain-containing protein [Aquificota bacterium]